MLDHRRPAWALRLLLGAAVLSMIVVAIVRLGDGHPSDTGRAPQPDAGVDRLIASSPAREAAPLVESSAVPDVVPDASRSTPEAAVPSSGEPLARQGAIAVAKEIWAKFDRLPGRTYRTRGALRSKVLLDATVRRANAAAATLGPDDAAAVHALNAAESRRRFPAVLGAGEKGSVRGIEATTIVPSSDSEQCTSMAESWLEGDVPRLLLEVGFSEIGCVRDGGFTSWRLDGHF